jgi:hypothetical protein
MWIKIAVNNNADPKMYTFGILKFAGLSTTFRYSDLHISLQ